MEFTIYALDERYHSDLAYFRIQVGDHQFFSPFYPAVKAAKQGVEDLIKRLRAQPDSAEQFIVELRNSYYLVLFSGANPVFNDQKPVFETEADAREVLLRMQRAAKQEEYDLPIFQLKGEPDWVMVSAWFDERRAYPTLLQHPRIELSEDDESELTTFSFRFRNSNRERILTSQAYPTEQERNTDLIYLIRWLARGASLESAELQAESHVTEAELQSLTREWLLVYAPRDNWQRTGLETFHLEWASRSVVRSPASLLPCDPIFKLFSPYDRGEFDLFFGREREADELYEQIVDHRISLVYGAARVGKTSLVQCGLAKKIEQAGWQTLRINGGSSDESMLDALDSALKEVIRSYDAEAEFSEETIPDLLQLLYELQPQPIFLLFDQLEACFTASAEEPERAAFFRLLNHLQYIDEFPCRACLVIREEKLAALADYERFVPNLLENRFHLRSLTKAEIAQAVVRMLEALAVLQKLVVKEPEKLAEKVSNELADAQGRTPFHCVQIYLHEMHQAVCRNSDRLLPALSPEAMKELPPPEEVVEQHIAGRIKSLQAEAENGTGVAQLASLQQIDELVASQNDCGCSKPKSTYAAVAPLVVNTKKERKLRGLLLLCLLALLAAVAFAAWMASYFNRQQDPCHQARQDNTPEAYLNYICTYGEEGSCTEEFRTILNEQRPEVWIDYLNARSVRDCSGYQAFLAEYSTSDVCGPTIRELLFKRGCPFAPTDTVLLTVRDTIVETRTVDRPQEFDIPSDPPCTEIGGASFKRVGPLWLMTSPINNGQPYTWEDALNACNARGFRLPCVGEIDYLISALYQGDPARAFQDLTSQNGCPVVDTQTLPGGKLGFWTGTESDDLRAWSFFFDLDRKVVNVNPGTPKNATIPCLCVETNQRLATEDLPPCYTKRIGR